MRWARWSCPTLAFPLSSIQVSGWSREVWGGTSQKVLGIIQKPRKTTWQCSFLHSGAFPSTTHLPPPCALFRVLVEMQGYHYKLLLTTLFLSLTSSGTFLYLCLTGYKNRPLFLGKYSYSFLHYLNWSDNVVLISKGNCKVSNDTMYKVAHFLAHDV